MRVMPFDKGGRSLRPENKAAASSEEGKETDSSRASSRNQPANTLTLAQWNWFQTSGLW